MDEARGPAERPYTLPRWLDGLRPLVALLLLGAPAYAALLVWYGGSPDTTDTGYQPEQPIPFSHALHAGELGVDCRYCHTTVERAAHAAIPPTDVCMACHAKIRSQSDKLTVLRDSYETGLPVPWVRVHDLPDYAYFDHSAHVRRGVSCVECHGRVDRMERVYQAAPLSMGWCLDCHRNPDPHLRPPELVTRLDWQAEGDPVEVGRRVREELGINPSEDCSTCHR